MTTILSNKAARNSLKKNVFFKKNKSAPTRLATQPNITIKNKVLFQTYCNTRKKIPTNSLLIVNKEKKESNLSKNMVDAKKVGLTEKSLPVNVEYYPDRCKRKQQAKKIKLQHKHEYVVVATTNKRKRSTPHKGVDSIQQSLLKPLTLQESPARLQSTALQESSDMEELPLSSLVQLVEEKGLDDEDLMEILTCPSPVWWEESNSDDDHNFTEEVIEVLDNPHEMYKKTTTHPDCNKKSIANNSLKSFPSFFKKFASKRSKLENILDNIKCTKISQSATDDTDKGAPPIIRTGYNIQEQNNNDIKEDVNDIEGHINEIEGSKLYNEFGNRTRKTSQGGLSDVSINEELLNTLESIELPVKGINNRYIKNKIEISEKPVENNDINVNNKRKRTRKPKKRNELKLKGKRNTVKQIKDKESVELEVPTDLPPLTKNPFKCIPKAFGSPKSIGSDNSETTNAIELDSISDTNIKFLDEYVDPKKEVTEAVNVRKYEKGLDGELVTVYQIVSNKTESMEDDIEQQIKVNLVNKSPQNDNVNNKSNSEINSFFKTRKSVYRSRSKYKKK